MQTTLDVTQRGSATVWRLLREDPDRYIYPAVKHGVELPLPPEIGEGLDTSKPNLLERRKNWNRPAPPEYALPTEIWREVVARRKRYEEVRRFLEGGTESGMEGGTGVSPVSSGFHAFSPFLPVDIMQRNLPHWQQAGTTYFVTFRLADSLPAVKLNQWKEEKEAWLKTNPQPWSEKQQAEYSRLFPRRMNEWLDAGEGACLLSQPALSEIVENALRYFEGKRYALDQFVIMPNHVHVLVAPMEGHELSDILHGWKSFTAHEINKRLNRSGAVWQDESFDHIVRSPEQLAFYRLYIKENTEKAGLKAGRYRAGRGSGVSTGVPPVEKNTESSTGVPPVEKNTEENTGRRAAENNTGGTPVLRSFFINDLITYNLDIRQFAQDVIENCEGPELLVAFWKAIERVTVLDPACGSGAFLFAALNILEPLYEACLERMRFFLDEWESSTGVPPVEKKREKNTGQRPVLHSRNPDPNYYKDFSKILKRVEEHPNHRYFVLKSIIVNNLYGVDIMEEAVEICKLRLFLKLVAQVERVEEIEPLPDIDFNIRAGNTLVGFASLDEVRKTMTLPDGTQYRMLSGEQKARLKRIEEDARVADRAFQMFQEMQTEQGMSPGDFAEAKEDLRSRLNKLTDELDRLLAGEYGVESSTESGTAVSAVEKNTESSTGVPPVEKEKNTGQRAVEENTGGTPVLRPFEEWWKSHRPFHWFAEFYGILKKGGFDVTIGNPPYVEYSKVKQDYTVRGYETGSCGNLYAFVIERSIHLLSRIGRFGMIVPLSSVSTSRMKSIIDLYKAEKVKAWLSFYAGDSNPSTFFSGVRNQLSIHLLLRQNFTILTTNYVRWFEQARDALFEALKYAEATEIFDGECIVKIGSEIELGIVKKLKAQQKPVSRYFLSGGSSRFFYRNASGSYYRLFLTDPPWIRINGRKGTSTTLKQQSVLIDPEIAVSVLSSTLFHWFWTCNSDNYHITLREFREFQFNVDKMIADCIEKLKKLCNELMADYIRNSKTRVETDNRNKVEREVQIFEPRKSKPIIDGIDRVLAAHYGFTEEELDFIINYDIKYRMGRDSEEGEEE